MRNPKIIITSIIEKIPVENSPQISRLETLKRGLTFRAPEDTLIWDLMHDNLMAFISKPTLEWHFEVWAIFTDKRVSEIKDLFNSSK